MQGRGGLPPNILLQLEPPARGAQACAHQLHPLNRLEQANTVNACYTLQRVIRESVGVIMGQGFHGTTENRQDMTSGGFRGDHFLA